GVVAAGADEVSATIAAMFGAHAQAYQALSAQAASFHQQFVQLMSGGASQYALTEAANASPLQTVGQGVMGGIGAPGQALAEGPPNAAPVPLANVAPASGTGATFAAFGSGGTGGAGGLIGGLPGGGGTSLAAAVGYGGGSFGTGGAGATGSLAAGENVLASGGAGEAAVSAEGLGIGGYGGTPAAAAPAAMSLCPPGTARPAAPTPAYSPAPAESSEE
ncbi:MAG TPA: PE family protein, partial [Mycobacterium sp.]|nr:PE family protein [Mycobacterium sp.]